MITNIDTNTLPPFFKTFSARYSGAVMAGLGAGLGSIVSTTWPTANKAVFVPIIVPFAYPAQRVFWVNGATVSGNVDVGIYDLTGHKIFTLGSTAQSGTSAVQYASVNWLVMPGTYYFAMASSSATATFLARGTGEPSNRIAGLLEQASDFALGTTMTGATATASIWPYWGMTYITSGF